MYSLISFEETNIPYAEIWELPGFNRGDNFMGLRFLSKDASATVLQGLRIETQTSDAADVAVERSLTQALSGAKIMDLEAINRATATYMRSGSVLVHRAEALLVAAYRESMPDVSFRRLRTAAGVTDLYVDGDAKVEIVEATRAPTMATSATHWASCSTTPRTARSQLVDSRHYSHDASQKSMFSCFTGTAWIMRIRRAMHCSNVGRSRRKSQSYE